MTLIIYAGGQEYHYTPEGRELKQAPVQGSNTDPINDNGKDPKPASKNPAPPAAPFPAKVAPKSSQPSPSTDISSPPPTTAPEPPVDNDPTSQPQIGPGTQDDRNDSYVGGSKVDPAPLPNPEGGALAPNPDNSDAIPTGGQNPNTFDDDSAKPDVKKLSWFMGKKGLTLASDPSELGLAKWPLDFKVIEKDFKRPNKVADPNATPQHTNNEDAEEVSKKEKPYQTGLPI